MTEGLGISRWIERRAELTPDAPALVHGTTTRTYAQLAVKARWLADSLHARGVGRGDRVVWLGDNHPAFIELLFATAQLGAVLAPVNHHLDDDVIHSLLERYAPTAVVLGRAAPQLAMPEDVRLRVNVAGGADADIEFEDLITVGHDVQLPVAVALDDVCLMPHTSGTTGLPKGVMLTHGNITWNAINLLSVADIRGDDVTIAVAPLFRSGGTGVNVLPVLFKGGTVVVPETGEPSELLQLVERHGVTIGFGNPDLLDALVAHPRWGETEFGSIRFFVTGGAPVPEGLIRTFQDRGITLLQGYGLSEAAPIVSLFDTQSALRKVGAAGRPPLYVDVRVTMPDGREASALETGELLVRGPNVMAGYWRDPEATRRAIDDEGWLHTGDAARLDADGDLWIVDRVADAYDVDGHRVFPGDVERVLMNLPGVVEAGVVFHRGSLTAAVVLASSANSTGAELMKMCRDHLPPHAIPDATKVVDRLPRSSVGKLLRHELQSIVDSEQSDA